MLLLHDSDMSCPKRMAAPVDEYQKSNSSFGSSAKVLDLLCMILQRI